MKASTRHSLHVSRSRVWFLCIWKLHTFMMWNFFHWPHELLRSLFQQLQCVISSVASQLLCCLSNLDDVRACKLLTLCQTTELLFDQDWQLLLVTVRWWWWWWWWWCDSWQFLWRRVISVGLWTACLVSVKLLGVLLSSLMIARRHHSCGDEWWLFFLALDVHNNTKFVC